MIGCGISIAQIAARPRVAAVVAPLTILLVGSSTTQKYFDTYTGPANANVTASATGTGFAALGTTGAGATNLGNLLNIATGRPIRFIKTGVNGTLLSDWEASPSTYRAAAVNAAIAAGGVDLILSIVGFNDAYQSGGSIVSQASHEAKLRSFLSKLRSEIGQPTVPVALGISQIYTGASTVTDDQFTWLHAAELNVAADTNNYFGAHAYDLSQLSDGIHQTSAAYPIHAARLANNIGAIFGVGTLRKGPTISAAAAVYNTKTRLTLTHDGASDFTPTTGLTGFEISFDDFATIATSTTAVREDGTHVLITHAASGGVAPKVRAFAGHAPNVAGVLKDNTSLALPVSPTKAPVVAPSGTSTVDPSASDTTPDAFSFTDVTGATVSTLYTSNTITVAGINAASPISITGGEYQIGSGSWVTASGTVVNGDTVKVRATSAGSAGAAVNVVLTIGGVSDTYTVTTSGAAAGFTDLFDYANGDVLSAHGWTSVSGAMTVESAEVYGSTIGNSLAPWTPATANYSVAVPLHVLSLITGNSLVLLHYQDESNYYWMGFIGSSGSSAWQIGRTLAGTVTSLASGTSTGATVGSTLNLEATVTSDGTTSTLTLKSSGTTIYTLTDTSAALQSKGQSGLRQSASAAAATTKAHFQSFTATAL